MFLLKVDGGGTVKDRWMLLIHSRVLICTSSQVGLTTSSLIKGDFYVSFVPIFNLD